MADQLPGMNILAVVMQAPTDIMGLATRQLTEAMSVFNLGFQKLGTELAVPPALPQGLPALPAGLPQLPMGLPQLPGLGAAPAAGAAAPTAKAAGYVLTTRGAPKLLGV
jgi:hypothetical protein